MPKTFTLEVAVPQRLLFRDQVESAQIPGLDGYFGVLPGHAPLISELGAGVLSFEIAGCKRYMALARGVAEVQPDRVRVLADTAEWAEEIDVERARLALGRARDLLQNHSMEIDVERAEVAVKRAQARLEASEQRQANQ
jgi:F-type H+-transporting ATPase subunit epsilon